MSTRDFCWPEKIRSVRKAMQNCPHGFKVAHGCKLQRQPGFWIHESMTLNRSKLQLKCRHVEGCTLLQVLVGRKRDQKIEQFLENNGLLVKFMLC